MTNDEQMLYLVSFLGTLVYRAGGELEIKNLSQMRGMNMILDMQLKPAEDKVILQVKRVIEDTYKMRGSHARSN